MSTENTTPHHYVLAHAAFRKYCESNPLGFFGAMASEEHRPKLLGEIWNSVRKHCDEHGEPPFSVEEIDVQLLRMRGHPTILLQMPEPSEPPQAHFVAIVLMVREGEEPEQDPPAFSYFTLEMAEPRDGQAATFVGSWRGEDNHVNHGAGPEPDPHAFLVAVDRILGEKEDAAGNGASPDEGPSEGLGPVN